MFDVQNLMTYVYGFFALLGIASVAALLKGVDWLIMQKYVTHHACEKCRGEVYKTIATDHDLLKELNGKMDLMLECMDIKHK